MATGDGDSDATRIERQRQTDLREARARDADREYERGKREERDLAHTAEQDRKLDALAADVTDLRARMSRMETSFGEFSAVAKAIAEKGVTNRTFFLGVLAIVIPLIILFIASGKHP